MSDETESDIGNLRVGRNIEAWKSSYLFSVLFDQTKEKTHCVIHILHLLRIQKSQVNFTFYPDHFDFSDE